MAQILLLHSSRKFRDRWTQIAEGEGHLVREAESVQEAKEILEKHASPCPVVVAGSDEIAEYNGETTAGIIELKKSAPCLCLVLVAPDPSIDEIASCIRAGAIDYLAESVEPSEIRRSLNAAVNRAATEDLNRKLEAEHRLYQEHLESLVDRHTADLRSIITRLIRIRDAEREEISVELHDQIGQDLLALKLQIQSLESAGDGSIRASTIIDRIDELASRVRLISHRLSPLFVQSAGIMTTIQILCNQCAASAGLVLQTKIDALENLPCETQVQSAIHRFLEEALSNVAKHSRANTASLEIQVFPHEVDIILRDNGCGFDTTKETGGLGILLLGEYASRLEGVYTLESAPGKGTIVTLHIPRKKFGV